MDPLALVGRLAKRVSCLTEVILEQPCFGQRAAQLQRFVAGRPCLLDGTDEQGRRVGALAALERFRSFGEEVCRGHARAV